LQELLLFTLDDRETPVPFRLTEAGKDRIRKHLRAQARHTIANLKHPLAAGGATCRDVVKTDLDVVIPLVAAGDTRSCQKAVRSNSWRRGGGSFVQRMESSGSAGGRGRAGPGPSR
jgi:hypothetical protein